MKIKHFAGYGSVNAVKVSKKTITDMYGKKKIQLPEAIKSLGVYEVNVKLHTKVTGKLKVKVIEE